MKTLLILFFLILSLHAEHRTQVHMGTLISVTVAKENVSDEVFAIFADLDNRLSTYKSDSEISRLNRDLDLNVSDVTRNVLNRSIEMSRLSDGAFDATIGAVTHGAYRFGYDNEHLPSKTQLQKSGKWVGTHRMKIKGNHVSLLPGTIIDLGGIGKGYAVDISLKLLRDQGVTKAIVSASGDIGCLGECVIDIQDPFHPQGKIATIHGNSKHLAVSTSGNYERYIKNKTHNHLIDPKTRKSQQQYASITLIDTKDNTRIDALATAVSVMEEEKAIRMLENLKIGYVLILNDGTIKRNVTAEGITLNFNILLEHTLAKDKKFAQ
jgi:thiamine biosynthesis lipoprotein